MATTVSSLLSTSFAAAAAVALFTATPFFPPPVRPPAGGPARRAVVRAVAAAQLAPAAALAVAGATAVTTNGDGGGGGGGLRLAEAAAWLLAAPAVAWRFGGRPIAVEAAWWEGRLPLVAVFRLYAVAYAVVELVWGGENERMPGLAPAMIVSLVAVVAATAIDVHRRRSSDEDAGGNGAYIPIPDESSSDVVPPDAVPPSPHRFSAASILFFRWMSPAISRGRTASLVPATLPPLSPTAAAATVTRSEFAPAWAAARGSLWRSLAAAFGTRLAAAGVFKLGNDALNFVPPLLLGSVVQFLQAAHAANAAGDGGGVGTADGLRLAFELLSAFVLQSLLFNQYFNAITVVQVRVRAALVGVVFNKALCLAPDARANFSSGAITNLMASDARRVADLALVLNMVWSSALQVVVALVLLVRLLGPIPTFVGLTLLSVSMPVQGWVIARMKRARERAWAYTDARIKAMSELLSSIKLVKLYAWETAFAARVTRERTAELAWIRTAGLLSAANMTQVTSLPIVLSTTAFVTYAVLGNRLDAAVVFPAIALFNVLRPPLLILPNVIVSISQASASVDRMERFLSAAELPPRNTGPGSVPAEVFEATTDVPLADVVAEDASFSWERPSPSSTQAEMELMESTILAGVSMRVPAGSLVAIVGRTGEGKTSLLNGLLGELHITAGRAGVRPSARVAFVEQAPFIVNGTLAENVTFGAPWDADRFDAALSASALDRDVAETLPAGAASEIGARGTTLSGGQRQRVSIARALYADADVVLLDCALSAVDAAVGRHIFHAAIVRAMAGKTRLMATNQLHHAAAAAVDYVAVVSGGAVVEFARRDELLADAESHFSTLLREQGLSAESDHEPGANPAAGVNGDVNGGVNEGITSDSNGIDGDGDGSHTATNGEPKTDADGVSVSGGMRAAARTTGGGAPGKAVSSVDGDDAREGKPLLDSGKGDGSAGGSYGATAGAKAPDNLAAPGPSGRLTEDETRSFGRVKVSNYTLYLSALGGVPIVGCVVACSIAAQTLSIALNFWLSLWSEASEAGGTDTNAHYLSIYLLLGVLSVGVTAAATTALSLAAVRASRVIHRRLLLSVLKAPMSWFDRTPLGRILNRFVSDLDKVDSTLSGALQSVQRLVLSLSGTIAVVLFTVPAFVVPLAVVGTIFFIVQEYYRPSSVDLRRLESVSRSPLISHFTEAVDGATTIRAYDGQARSRATNAAAMDDVNRFAFLGASANRWLATRLDLLSTLLTFCAVALVVVFRDTISPSLAGLMLSYLLGLSSSITWVVRQVTDTESQMSSLERIEEYSGDAVPHENNDVGQQPDDPVGFSPVEPIKTPVRVRSGWPRTGRIEFQGVTMRYRPDLPPVLDGVTFTVAPGERVGIVGRTGAGKSSLVAALFRLAELDSGRILVDGVDVSQLPLSTLRSRLSILPQEAFIFSSTIRGNLDPLDEATDAQVWAAIEAAGLKSWVKSLSTPVLENGVSAGQRQLLCLGRVLLRDASVLVLDEATASVDAATDTAVGQTIATKLGTATTLTIAHRLRSVIDSDKILVLDRGRVVEYAQPAVLLADPTSALSSLVDETGPATAEVLRSVARAAATGAARGGGDSSGADGSGAGGGTESSHSSAPSPSLGGCRRKSAAAAAASPARAVLDAYSTLRVAIMTADSEPTVEVLRHLGVSTRAWQGRLRTMVDRLATLAAEHCGASGEVDGFTTIGSAGSIGIGMSGSGGGSSNGGGGDGSSERGGGSVSGGGGGGTGGSGGWDGLWLSRSPALLARVPSAADADCCVGSGGCSGGSATPRRRRADDPVGGGALEAASAGGWSHGTAPHAVGGAGGAGGLSQSDSMDDLAVAVATPRRRAPVGMLPVLSLSK